MLSHFLKLLIEYLTGLFDDLSSFPKNIAEVFPTISLNFAGDASMNLTPTDYLEDMDGAAKWCIRFIRNDLSRTILGDAALKDRIILFHLQLSQSHQQCTHAISFPQGSLPVNVSITSGTYDVLLRLAPSVICYS
ncbi:hypothetical protein H5410_001467 [Solanum commersonii]|uniref:Xylanase inhibitor C-terminal domain-containing protein n=1 Tax=Solanum commersonii TaxID=4109 RepID=A0A9J6AZ18_SOLCO|nr:hypothetical protein H5410_001467 [Solanum commersonii]